MPVIKRIGVEKGVPISAWENCIRCGKDNIPIQCGKIIFIGKDNICRRKEVFTVGKSVCEEGSLTLL